MKIVWSRKFERSVKKYKKKNYDISKIAKATKAIVNKDIDLLKTKYRDHALKGQWSGHRELHL